MALHPGAFFRRVRVDQPGSAVLFAVIAYTIGNVFQGFYSLATGSRGAEMLESVAEGMPEEQARYVRMYVESLSDSYRLLDQTPYGRQEDWETSPKGWPQKPTYG